MKYSLMLCLIISILDISGCKDNNAIVNPAINEISQQQLTKTEVHLMYGFTGRSVIVEINHEREFFAVLSEAALMSGPNASFSTYLGKGENNIRVLSQNLNNMADFFIDSVKVNIGDKDKYFIGLQFADSLQCFVHDSTFEYW